MCNNASLRLPLWQSKTVYYEFEVSAQISRLNYSLNHGIATVRFVILIGFVSFSVTHCVEPPMRFFWFLRKCDTEEFRNPYARDVNQLGFIKARSHTSDFSAIFASTFSAIFKIWSKYFMTYSSCSYIVCILFIISIHLWSIH